MTLVEGMGSFSRYAVMKTNSATKEFYTTNIATKEDLPNHEMSVYSSLYFNCQNYYHLGATVIFNYAFISPSPFLFFESSNDSL